MSKKSDAVQFDSGVKLRQGIAARQFMLEHGIDRDVVARYYTIPHHVASDYGTASEVCLNPKFMKQHDFINSSTAWQER